ncbi:GIY-YIG nuclease family protein [Caldibacillus lycopersici]|uniref:GIY-YIG nuclease family protein n=1 Tax=Perspicuibacillus lycopersici TaxID=1325689 RepID=A0AAE3IRA6_9BACI|nr:GIY-YIG nuclease family protein [Perspicuibacillus lycopersici]MCU9613145.1 GIY-YIG nuclease family protein [Perspicuibacillus lycopersici]
MNKEFTRFLEALQLLPVDKWDSCIVDHTKEYVPGKGNAKIRNLLKQKCTTDSGVYGYFNQDGECLYIGMANDLSGRIYGHYKAAWVEVSKGTNRDPHQLPFFKEHKGIVNVRWYKIADIFERQAIEAMLTRVLKPKYIEFMRERQKVKKVMK